MHTGVHCFAKSTPYLYRMHPKAAACDSLLVVQGQRQQAAQQAAGVPSRYAEQDLWLFLSFTGRMQSKLTANVCSQVSVPLASFLFLCILVIAWLLY